VKKNSAAPKESRAGVGIVRDTTAKPPAQRRLQRRGSPFDARKGVRTVYALIAKERGKGTALEPLFDLEALSFFMAFVREHAEILLRGDPAPLKKFRMLHAETKLMIAVLEGPLGRDEAVRRKCEAWLQQIGRRQPTSLRLRDLLVTVAHAAALSRDRSKNALSLAQCCALEHAHLALRDPDLAARVPLDQLTVAAKAWLASKQNRGRVTRGSVDDVLFELAKTAGVAPNSREAMRKARMRAQREGAWGIVENYIAAVNKEAN